MWHKNIEKPVKCNTLFVIKDNMIDWIPCDQDTDVSVYDGWMYFSDVCKALKLIPEMLEALKQLKKYGYLHNKYYNNERESAAATSAMEGIAGILKHTLKVIKKAEGRKDG